MPTFMVTDPETGIKLKLTGDSAPTEQELNDIFSAQAPKQPTQPSDNAPKSEWEAYYKATVKPQEPSLLQSEVVSPLASAVSTGLTAGIAKEGLGAINPEMKARMFPEQRTIPGKILRGGAELTATLAGLPARAVIGGINLAAKAAPKYILPAAKTLQGTMGQKIATGALGGAIGGASLAAENLDMNKQAAQVGIGAVTGGVLPVAAKPVEKFLSPLAQKTAELVKKNAKVYRNVLNPGKDIIQKVEVKSGKKIDDFMELAADENLVLNQTPEGKLDTKAAVTALKDRKVELNAQLESALESDPSKRFSLVDIGEKAKLNLAKHTRNASELKSAIKSVDDQIADEIALHGDVVDGITANRIKGGMWDVSYSPLEPNRNKISRQIGFSIKDAIEQAYPDQAIKETNKRLGDFVTLESILKKSDGNVVQRGRIGNYVGNIVGMGIGGGLGSAVMPGVGTAVGSAAGAAVGGATSKFLANPERITKALPKDVSKLQKLGSELGQMAKGIKIPVAKNKTTIPSRSSTSNVPVKGKTPINKKVAGTVIGGTAIGLAGNAEAGQDIDMDKIYSIESSNNPKAHNKSSNAKGLGQITSIVLKEWNNFHPKEKHSDGDLFNADTNKKIASWYMNKRVPALLKAFKKPDTTENRLIAYNAGIGRVGKILPKETANYLKKYKGA